MRYSVIGFALLEFATALPAAEPYAGTWKLDPAKSTFTKGEGPKEQTITIAEKGKQFDVNVEGTASDGKPNAVHYMVPLKGGNGKMMNTAYDAISSKRISTNERENTFSKGGKVAFTAHSTIAPDGKTMTVATKGTNPAGQDTDGTVTCEKQ